MEPCFDPGGDEGRLGATEENPDMVPFLSPEGDIGIDWASCSKPFCFPARCAGVEAFRVNFGCLLGFPGLNDCDCDLARPFVSHSPLLST